MAGSGCGSGTGSRDLFNCPDSVRTRAADVSTKINLQPKEGARKGGHRIDGSGHRTSLIPQCTSPHWGYRYRPDEFVSDEMSELGSIDFVALGTLRDHYSGRSAGRKREGSRNRNHTYPESGGGGQNGGYYAYPETSRSRSTAKREPDLLIESHESVPAPAAGVQKPLSSTRKDLGTQPVFISRKKEKAKLRKLRWKALKAAAKAQAVQDLSAIMTVHDVANSTMERHQVIPEQEGKKRKERLMAADEPEFKMFKTGSSGGDEPNTEDSAHTLEAVERSADLVPASSLAAERTSSDAVSHTEDTSKDLTPAPASRSADEGQSCSFMTSVDSAEQKKQSEAQTEREACSTQQQGRHSQTPDGRPRKRGYSGKQGMKITAKRIAFVCPVCKFSSFYRKKFAAHLESKFHKDHFKFLSEHLSEPTVDFLQTHFSIKHKQVENLINRLPNHRAAICQLYEDRDLTRDISMKHFMRKAEAAHCIACGVYIPMQRSLIQQHLKSPDHNHNCKIMMAQSKNSGLAIAQNILSHRFMHNNLKFYLKKSMVADGSKVKQDKVRSTGQRDVPDAKGAEPFCEPASQAIEAVSNGKKQEMEPLSEGVVPAAEAVSSGKDQEAEPFCEPVIQSAEVVGKGKDQEEVEPLSEGVVPAPEAEYNGKEEPAELMCERVAPAAEEIRNEDVEPEKHDLSDPLHDLLDEEEDMEGVELGEEELGEDDFI